MHFMHPTVFITEKDHLLERAIAHDWYAEGPSFNMGHCQLVLQLEDAVENLEVLEGRCQS